MKREKILKISLSLPGCRSASLKIKEHFVPAFVGEPLHVYCKPAVD